MTLPELSKKMQHIDFCIFNTHTDGGEIAGRPMSNNGDVEYQGDSYYFAWDDSRVARDISREPKVSLALQGKGGLLGKPPLMISIEGEGELIKDKARFAEHWKKELERWFKEGIETPGLVMIKVHAKRIHYWDGEEQGEVKV